MYIRKIMNNILHPRFGKYHISKQTTENTQKLLRMMNRSTKYDINEAGTSFESDILSSINMGKVRFSDIRMYITPVREAEKNISDCTLEIGKNLLVINSTTGEITAHRIGWLTSWKYLKYRAESAIKQMVENFNNPDVVQKKSFKIAGFTKLGFENLNKIKNNI